MGHQVCCLRCSLESSFGGWRREESFIGIDALLLQFRNLTIRKSRNLESSLADEQLVLYGNLSVLGLLIMKNKTIAPPDADSADFSIFKFMQVSEQSRNLSTMS